MVEIQQREGVVVARITGRLDAVTTVEAEGQTAQLASSSRVVLDLSQLTYISSAGLRLLLKLGKQVKEAGGRLVVAALQPMVEEVFQMTGFDKMFEIAADATEAERRLLQP